MAGNWKQSDSVLIQISGPKSILPDTLMQRARLDMTWMHFLNSICGLQLDSDSDYFICTSYYSTISPESGWTANLNDMIKPFVDKFSRKRAKYCIRLHTGSEPNANTSCNDVSFNSSATGSPWMPSIFRKPAQLITKPVKKFAYVVPLTPAQFSSSGMSQATCLSDVAPTREAQCIPTNGPQIQNQSRIASSARELSNSAKIAMSKQQRAPNSRMAHNISEIKLCVGSTSGDGTMKKQSSLGIRKAPVQKRRRFVGTAPNADKSDGTMTKESVQSHPRDSFADISRLPKIKRLQGCINKRADAEGRNNGKTYRGRVETEVSGVGVHKNNEQVLEKNVTMAESTLNSSDRDEEGDSASMYTAVTVENQELHNSGIPVQDIKSLIECKIDKIDESTFRRVRNEIRRLRKNKVWDRNVRRSPLLCYLLSELFKD